MNPIYKDIADELLVKYLLNECTPDEQQKVAEWLQLEPSNLSYYEHFKFIWEQSKNLSTNSQHDEEAAWLRLTSKMGKRTNRLQFYTPWLKYAAILFIAATLFFIWKKNTQFHDIVVVPKQIDSTISPPLQQMTDSSLTIKIDTLSDKSVVTLNKYASIQYPKHFEANERRVSLKGEAFFSITPDKKKPFYINASNDVEIKVVGTSFNVKAFDLYTEVIVETGIVEVRKFNKLIILHPNERAKIDKSDSSIHIEKNKDRLYRYYRSKEFECDNTPLWRLIEVLNEAYDDTVIITRDELKSEKLNTRFENESLSDVLEVIAETFELKVEKKGNKYILK